MAKKETHPEPQQVVAIGASAGGLAACQKMLPELPVGHGIAYVLVQHLDPNHRSQLHTILQRSTRLETMNVIDGDRVKADCLYIIPPDKDGRVLDGRISLESADHPKGPRHSVDVLFASVAKDCGVRGVGVILSGTGSDGLQGARAIKAAEGLVIVQDPATAEYTGMPSTIVHERLADVVLPPEKIGDELIHALRWPEKSAVTTDTERDTFDALIRLLVRKTGIALDQYKETTLQRRLERRRIVTRSDDLSHYLALVERSDTEAELLLQDTLISVTNFFRDPDSFDALRKAIKTIVSRKTVGETLRIWVAGCATGEEAFSIAMLLAEELSFSGANLETQIFATDIDEQAIKVARKGVYLKPDTENIPETLVEKYFVATDGTYHVSRAIRDMVTFAKHDLMQDPPFSRLDLVSCRNVLIYFKRITQERLIRTFHYVLKKDGYLALGSSETIGKLTQLFEQTDPYSKLYRRCELAIPPPVVRRNKHIMPRDAGAVPERKDGPDSLTEYIRDLVFESYVPVGIVVGPHFNLLHSHGDVSAFIKLPQGAISINVLDMANEALRLELRLILQKMERERRLLRSHPIVYNDDGRRIALTLVAVPVGGAGEVGRQTLVLFETRPIADQSPEINENDEVIEFRVRELEQELVATRDHLHTNIEDLEASNEELQSVNEEFQSTTEELQSANEELQTANEELQSTNEELNTVNEELRIRSEELVASNRDLESILDTALSGIVVLDRDLRVTRYSSASREIFNLLPTSIGKPLIAIGGAIDLAPLSRDIHAALAGGTTVERELDLGERSFVVRFVPQVDDHDDGGLLISFIEVTDALAAARQSRRLGTVLHDSSDAITVISSAGSILSWNRGAEKMYGYTEAEALSMNMRAIMPAKDWKQWQALTDRVYRGDEIEPCEANRRHKNGREFEVSVVLTALLDLSGEPYAIAATERDISPIREAEAQRRQAEFAHEARIMTAGEMAAGLAHELNQPVTSIVHFCDVAKSIAEQFDPTKQAELDEVLDDAAGQAHRAGNIIRSLRRFLERRETVRTRQSMNHIIERAIKFLKTEFENANVSVKFSPTLSLPLVKVDATQIEQVLVNLLRNSVDAMLEADSETREIFVVARGEENTVDTVHVTVQDTGPGVGPETADRLFQPFHTEKPNGLGMGLWMSRSLIEGHGGKLWCDEGNADGAVFGFSLPVADDMDDTV